MHQPKKKSHSNDEELVNKIVHKRDTQLFAILYDKYAEKVYHKCLSFVKSTEEAQDLTHDIFIKLFVKLGSFKGQSKFSTWLYSFTYNFCVNHVNRKLKKQKEKFVATEDLYEGSYFEEVSDEKIFQLKTDKLQKALEKIDVEVKTILLMKYQDDFTIKEIMEAFNIGESAAKMRLNRAKAKLIEVYKEL